ncbi:MAG: hypothetical protein AAGA30_05750 [Planctomycetota bacterium]
MIHLCGKKLWMIVLAMFWLAGIFGCYNRQAAPELEFSPAEVEKIREEIKSTDWE